MSLKHAERTLRAALDGVTAELESMLRAEVIRQSKRRGKPGRPVIVRAFSAMGTWTMDYSGPTGTPREIANAPVFRAFDRVQQAYGWNAIPAPVMFISSDGESALRQESR